jgi:hypothetical protein
MIALIPLGVIFIIAAVVGVVSLSASHSGAAGGALLGVGALILYAIFIVFIFYVTLFTFGYLIALLEGLGIYFLAGRYPLLGNILEPGPGAPFAPPPVFPSDEERKDSDGGPPMPMDPAVA